MKLEVPNLMEMELTKAMESDLTRLLAGTDIRADGSAITAESMDANIKNLFGSSFYDKAPSSTNFEPTVSGANNSASIKPSGGNQGGNGDKPADTNHHPDISLPAGLQKLTGAKTVGEFLGQGVQTVVGGALTAINPVAGLAFKGALSIAKGATVEDAAADVAVSLNPFSSMAVKALGAIGAYDRAEGLLTSASDAYQTVNNTAHVPTTLAGRNVINHQVEAAKQATGHYDSSRGVQQRASQAALNRDNAPSYARPGYGASLQNASNPAKNTSGGSSKNSSYQSAGQIGKTDSSKGHAAAGGVGPSPSKGGSNSKTSSSSTGKGSSTSKGSSNSKSGSSKNGSSSSSSKGSSGGKGKGGK